MRKLFVIFLASWQIVSFAQEKPASGMMNFSGYIQVRANTNFYDHAGFSMRRLKLWVKSTPQFSEDWSYKVQVTFSSLLHENFFLQDVKGGYKSGLFSVDFGQFVPQYSLQRFQHDYLIPLIERAKVINALIPDGSLGVRDLGLQANLTSRNGQVETHLGLFNGYGIKEYRLNNKGFMITHKTSATIPLGNQKILAGYSLQYRRAQDLTIRFVLPDTVTFTGNDLRYNFFAMYRNNSFLLQAEYLNASFDGKRAYGYYLLSSYDIGKHQIVLSYEDYHDLIRVTVDKPYYRIGYNYLIRDYKIKLSVDNYFQLNNGNLENYYATLQLQLFFK